MIQIWQVPSECSPSNLVVLGLGDIEQHEFIEDVSTKDIIVSDGNDTETSSFGVIHSENEVQKQQPKNQKKFSCVIIQGVPRYIALA